MSCVKLDLLCPVKNGGEAFLGTIRSMKCPELKDLFRIVISDNYSTDDRPWMVALDEMKDCNIELLKPPRPLDRIEHWNWLAGKATSDTARFIMSGDIPAIIAARKAVDVLLSDPTFAFTFGPHEVSFEEKVERHSCKPPVGRFDRDAALRLCLDVMNPFGGPSGVTFRRDKLCKVLPFEVEYPWSADMRLFLRCLEHGSCFGLEELQQTQERRIARFSSSRRAIWIAFKEEWVLHSEVQQLLGVCGVAAYRNLFSTVLLPTVAKLGRALIPLRPRKWLGAIYRKITGCANV